MSQAAAHVAGKAEPAMLGALRSVVRPAGRAAACRCSSNLRAMATCSSTGGSSDGSRDSELAVSCTAGGLARATLHRPQAINALDAELVERLRAQLITWSDSSAGVRAVLLDSALAPRSFCSGGDVRAARLAVLAAPYSDAPPAGHHIHRVFQAEYSLVCLVAAYPVPVISMCHGIWMGLGVGISIFGKYRVVTDATVFAMPENIIGLWPDVGFAHVAARCPRAVGLYLGLTGARVTSPSDLLWAGIATHYVPSNRVEDLTQAFIHDEATPEAIERTLHKFCCSTPPEQGPLQCMQPLIDRLFGAALQRAQQANSSQGNAAALAAVAALQQLQQDLTQELRAHPQDSEEMQLLKGALDALRQHSPTSLAITLRHYAAVDRDMRSGGTLAQLQNLMQLEYAMAVRRISSHDFCEGVRAALVDKDRAPTWQPQTLADVRAVDVEAVFAPLSEGGLALVDVQSLTHGKAAIGLSGRAAFAGRDWTPAAT